MLVDSHCHLNFPPLSQRREEVLARAAAAGVERVIVPAYDVQSWPAIAALAAAESWASPAYGLHPWCADATLDLDALAAHLAAGAVAVGEIGLDSKVEPFDRDRQLELLTAQVALAVELDLPVILHCRGAFDDLIAVLERHRPRGVVHAYSRGPELADRLLSLGLHLGFGGAVTRPNAKRPRRSAVTVPLDRIVLETDAPSIGLDGIAPEDAEPRHVLEVAKAISELRGVPVAEVARVTTRNARELFALP